MGNLTMFLPVDYSGDDDEDKGLALHASVAKDREWTTQAARKGVTVVSHLTPRIACQLRSGRSSSAVLLKPRPSGGAPRTTNVRVDSSSSSDDDEDDEEEDEDEYEDEYAWPRRGGLVAKVLGC
ncbi:hypothetical protein HPB51_015031 [Rhipicephalus microplus]|uniref:Uncharacterized protein n=1 Tax=Rhipicephalus microplus TaxID=6941 RepID=A0A9J6ETQ6_RHIMP|nr:hypothetical protein HPB51_015031 [Rhipicephalus microplus]